MAEILRQTWARVPDGVNACSACIASDGMPPGWVNVFHLFLRLQDERGNAQITVSVDQNVRFLRIFSDVPGTVLICQQSNVLRGVFPDEVVGASAGTALVRERLANYIGNIEAVQAANSQGRTLAADVPVREFTIESWRVEDGETGVI